MDELVPSLFVVVAGLVAVGSAGRAYEPRERSLFLAALVSHWIAAGAQILITRYYYGGGDIFYYEVTGRAIARAMEIRPSLTWEVVRLLLLEDDVRLPVEMFGIGTSTGAMCAVSAFLMYLLDGSLLAVCLCLGTLAVLSKIALYAVLRESFPESLRPAMGVAALLVPSVVFWSAALAKETIVMIGLGPLLLGVRQIVEGRYARGVLPVLLGGFLVAIAKPYTLFAFVIAAALWLYVRRASAATIVGRPLYLVIGIVVAIGGLILLGAIFPRYSLDTMADEIASRQEGWARIRVGSSYAVASTPTRSLAGQLAFAPLALLTALFRPFILEARNVPMLVASLETMAISLYAFRTLVMEGRWREMGAAVLRTPMLLFSVAFIVIFGVAIGLSTGNMGSLVRYRIAMMPFLLALVAALGASNAGELASSAAPALAAASASRPRPRPVLR